MGSADYEKEIRRALKNNKTYDKGFEPYIKKAAMISVLIDELQEAVKTHGAVIENWTREGHLVKKKNPALDDLPKMFQQYSVYMTQLCLTPKSSEGVTEDDPVNKLLKKVNSISA